MSFRTGPRAGASQSGPSRPGIPAKVLGSNSPSSRDEEEGCYEKQIKNSIQKLQNENLVIKDELRKSKMPGNRRRSVATLQNFLARTHDIAQGTEDMLRDWQVFLASEPHERHRKKFSIEKLRRAFDEEVRQLKDSAAAILLLQEEQLAAPNGLDRSQDVDLATMCEDDNSEEEYLLQGELETSMLEDRTAGIRRIQGEMSSVNKIFKDLACIVQEQGQVLDSIESSVASTVDDTSKAHKELKKASDRMRASRERMCCLLLAVLIFLFYLLSAHGWGWSSVHTAQQDSLDNHKII